MTSSDLATYYTARFSHLKTFQDKDNCNYDKDNKYMEALKFQFYLKKNALERLSLYKPTLKNYSLFT